MWKIILPILFIAPAYSQNFTEDISKINHVIAEQQIEESLNKPNPDLEAVFLDSLMDQKYLNPLTNCEDDPLSLKPQFLKYEVIAVTEEFSADPNEKPRLNYFVAKYKEEESPLITKLKDTLTKKAQEGSNGTPGRFELKKSADAGKHFILFAAPGTNIKVDSNVKTEGAYAVDLSHFNYSEVRAMDATLKMDIVNRISVNQSLGNKSSFKGSVESLHSTGARSIDSLGGTDFDLNTVKAQARLDSQIKSNVHTYSEVNYTANSVEKGVRTVAGFDIRTSSNAEILVFTGVNNRYSSLAGDPNGKSRDREFGVEYKPRKGVSVYGRVKEDNKGDKAFETGLKFQLR